MGTMCKSFVLVVIAFVFAFPSRARAKEKHFEQVRAFLISKTARCTSCHIEAQSGKLNAYGERIAGLPHDDPLADRIAALESEPSGMADEQERRRAEKNRDVDGDGVLNWIEILAETNPADKDDKPAVDRVKHIEAVISCKLCHRATNLPGEGLAANPHNEFGELLSTTYVKRSGRKNPRGPDAERAAAERTQILTRLSLVRKNRPKKSKATYWQKIRLLHGPADPDDNPSREELRSFKKQIKRQKGRSKRDPNLGLSADAHKPDGFFLDAAKLD